MLLRQWQWGEEGGCVDVIPVMSCIIVATANSIRQAAAIDTTAMIAAAAANRSSKSTKESIGSCERQLKVFAIQS